MLSTAIVRFLILLNATVFVHIVAAVAAASVAATDHGFAFANIVVAMAGRSLDLTMLCIPPNCH